MNRRDPYLRFVLAIFPPGFRSRLADDLLDTVDDVLAAAAPSERPRARLRILAQLARAGAADRCSSWLPSRPSIEDPRSRSSAMDDLMHDLRSAFRSLFRRPAFAAMVVITLAIGLGTSAAMFSVVHGVLLKPLPFPEPDRLVTLYRHFTDEPGRETGNMSLPDLRDMQRQVGSLEAVAGYGRGRQTMLRDGEPQLVTLGRLSDGLLPVFGLRPHLGRDLTAEDAAVGAPRAVVLGFDFWLQHFGGDPGVVGNIVELSGEPHTIVGVGPQGFSFPDRVEGWVPWQVDTEGCGRGCHLMTTVARLAEGATAGTANLQLETLGAALEAEYPDSNTHKRFAARRLHEHEVAPVQSALWLLLGAVQLVVLIAAANVANLVLVRGTRRRRELAIRTAVGAGRGRLFRQLMLENGMLALAGAAAGLLVGQAALKVFMRLAPEDLPRFDQVGLDATVFAFTAAMALLVLLVFGLLPSLSMAQTELRSRGAAGTPRGRRSRALLLTGEVALALVLLLGAGLLIRSFSHMARIELGFEPERVTRFSLLLPDAAYPQPEQAVAFAEQLEERLRSVPGVEAAGLVFAGPFGDNHITSSFQPLDRPEPAPGDFLSASFDVVTPGYFDTLKIPMVRGRAFEARDDRQAPMAVVISRSLAERYYPDKDPIGETAKVGISFGFEDEDAVYTIIGIADEVRAYSLTDQPEPAAYLAQAQTGSQYLSVMVRSRPGHDVMPAVREQVLALDPMMPLRSVETQEAAVAEAYGPQRFYLALLATFAAIALLLSAIGLYSVVAYLVSQRTRELAVRMALGADAGRVLRLVLGDALRPAAVGIAVGLLGAWLGARVLDSMLYGITAHDTLTYAAAPLLLLAVALLASLVPAARAARLQPRVALEEN